ncbi:E3 binding domain-containing protein [Asanoa siamensis]|uniref:Peripheral subunit-binding (PSBD) domain-containing protein n=1 Tax=Asanoa siamensis TaxID=926357 RepID=A0ABQ4CT29_9ACTN|nr:E3 binding domain-containing protein [Asanoa siamensis]GIF74427.1 hypothetical protein Asi02nite_39450 [Asanoa siamensis]
MTLAQPTGYLSPAVRALARLHAFEPSAIAGTGVGGRVTLADVLATLAAAGPAPSSSARPAQPGRPEDGLIETAVDVTGGDRTDAEIGTAVQGAVRALHIGQDVPVVVGGPGTTRVVPPLEPGRWLAVGVGAPSWTATAALTASGERVLAARLHRSVVVRWAAGDGRHTAEALLRASATVVGRGQY